MQVFGGDDTAGVVREAHGDAVLSSASCCCFDDDVKSSDTSGPNTDLRNAIAFRARRCPRQRETALSANVALRCLLTLPARSRSRTRTRTQWPL